MAVFGIDTAPLFTYLRGASGGLEMALRRGLADSLGGSP